MAAAVILLILAGVAYLASFNGAIHPTSSSSSATTSTVATSTNTSALHRPGVWTTYHKDNSRSGFEQSGNISTVTTSWNYSGLDGLAYGEPLVLGGTVFVATENNSVYAIATVDGSLIWRTHVGKPVPGGSLPCGNIDPSGITSTPVIDATTRTLYAVAFLAPSQHIMFGIDIDTGAVKSQAGVDPPGADPRVEQQRGALALSNGVVYIPYGGLAGDCGAYHGWVVGAFVNGSANLLSYQVPTNREGGIWAPSGVTIAPDGDVYVATGNGDSTTSFDYSNSVVRLSPSLQVLDYFAASNWAQLNAGDRDLGSLAPTLMPDGDVFQIGKAGTGYLLSGDALGGVGGQLYSADVCSGAFGGTAKAGQSVFIPCTDGVFRVVVGASKFSVGWRTSGFNAGPPVVTGDVLWAVDISHGKLLGFNAATGEQRFSFTIGPVVHFCTPAAADGLLFVAAGTQLRSFALA